jgi:hypothetical protein
MKSAPRTTGAGVGAKVRLRNRNLRYRSLRKYLGKLFRRMWSTSRPQPPDCGQSYPNTRSIGIHATAVGLITPPHTVAAPAARTRSRPTLLVERLAGFAGKRHNLQPAPDRGRHC